MEKKIIKTEDAPAPIGPYSQAVKVGNLLFISGQGPIDPITRKTVSGGIREQTKQALENIKNILKAAGLTLNNVAKITIFLRDIRNFSEMNEIYQEYFKLNQPARTTVQSIPPDGIAIEIDAIAYIPE